MKAAPVTTTAQRKTCGCGNTCEAFLQTGEQIITSGLFCPKQTKRIKPCKTESVHAHVCMVWTQRFAQPHSALLEMIPSPCDIPESKITSTCKLGIQIRGHKESREFTIAPHGCAKDETEECRLQGEQDRQVCRERSAFLLFIFNS